MIYLLAIAFRLYDFGALPGTDELARNLSYPPLYRWLAMDLLWLGRLISLIAGVYVVYACHRLGGCLAGYCAALSPILISYSKLAQPDMLMTAMVMWGLRCTELAAAVPFGIAIATKWNAALAFGGYVLYKARDWRTLLIITPVAGVTAVVFAFPVLFNPSGYLDRLMYESASQSFSFQNGSTYMRFFQFVFTEPYAVSGFVALVLYRQWKMFLVITPALLYCGWQPKGDIHYCLWALPVLAVAFGKLCKWDAKAVVFVALMAFLAIQIKPEDPRIQAKAWIESNLPGETIGLYGGEYAPRLTNPVVPLVQTATVNVPASLGEYLTNPKYINILSRRYIDPPKYVLLCSAAYERFYGEVPEHPPERYYYQQNRAYVDRLLHGEVVQRWGTRPHILLIRTR